MARTATIHVDPALVRWARKTAGYSLREAAGKAHLKATVLNQWETQPAAMTARQLERLAHVYRRPVAAFFLPAPPREPHLPDFRVPAGAEGPLSFDSRLAIRRARRLQRVFSELGERVRVRLPRIGLNDDPEDSAEAIRALLGVSLERQTSWQKGDVALAEWRAAVEKRGPLVFQFKMPVAETSGFSLSDTVPAIVLNKADAEVRRIFTLFHELAHVLLGRTGVCAITEEALRNTSRAEEVFCNAFAAGFLVPMATFKTSEPYKAFRRGDVSLDQAAEEGARYFSVSRPVLLRRLLTAGAISRVDYEEAAERWRLQARPKKKRRGRNWPHRTALRELGVPFVSRVLASRDRGVITDGDVADYLSIRLKWVEPLRTALPGSAA